MQQPHILIIIAQMSPEQMIIPCFISVDVHLFLVTFVLSCWFCIFLLFMFIAACLVHKQAIQV